MEYMKLFIDKVVDTKTRGSCIPIDSVKSGDDCSILVDNIWIETYIDLDKTNLTCMGG